MSKVVFTQEAFSYLEELAHILYYKNYFSTEAAAEKYVRDLWENIMTDLSFTLRRQAPVYFDRFGKKMYYATFRKNKQTYWYVFFSIYNTADEPTYLVRYITNNHTAAQLL